MNSTFWRNMKQGMIHLLYPRLCEGCGKPLLKEEEILCIGCNLQVPETNFPDLKDNEAATRFAGRVPYQFATSYAYFTADGLLQHLLHGLKYKGKKEIGHFLGKRLGKSIKNNFEQKDSTDFPDVIIPVPLHKKKMAVRGYNQSTLIAEGLSEVLRIPVAGNNLVRTRNTESQTNKTRVERINNMTEAFEIKDKHILDGKHVLLCDDVLTTGATIEACARTLMSLKTLKISIATIGIAVS